MKVGDRVEVTRTYFARNEACTNWGRACFPTQGIVEFVSNRWVSKKGASIVGIVYDESMFLWQINELFEILKEKEQ